MSDFFIWSVLLAGLFIGVMIGYGYGCLTGHTKKLVEAKDAEIQHLLQRLKIEPLTKLLNRETFFFESEKCLEHNLYHDQRHSLDADKSMSASVFFMDLDNFKPVNDTHGHDVGDIVLKKVGEVLMSSFRSQDVVGRIGGEEFAAVLPNTGVSEAKAVAEKIRKAVESIEFEGIDLVQTVSIGVVTADGSISSREILKLADEAMYQAKESGKNQVQYRVIEKRD